MDVGVTRPKSLVHHHDLRTEHPLGNPWGDSWLSHRLPSQDLEDAAGAAFPSAPCRSRHWYSHDSVGMNANLARARSLPAATQRRARRCLPHPRACR